MSRETESPPHVPKMIPKFSSYEEEAEFWDTHDVTDYIDESQPPVSLPTFAGHQLHIPISSDQMQKLSAEAEAAGTDIITVVQRWILERLENTDRQPVEKTAS